jgi:hypothetical protein
MGFNTTSNLMSQEQTQLLESSYKHKQPVLESSSKHKQQHTGYIEAY